jgi:asparagine synthase (glutamine-hydrolysing)
MCGILAWLGRNAILSDAALHTLKARGPEGTRVKHLPNGLGGLGFTRLAINGLNDAGMQPMEHNEFTWVANGEIYNWRELNKTEDLGSKSGSDCEVIGRLLAKYGISRIGDVFRALDGVFAVCVVDIFNRVAIVARDPYGVRPLFKGHGEDGAVYFGSEMKSLVETCNEITAVQPGTYELYSLDNTDIVVRNDPVRIERYHHNSLLKMPVFEEQELAFKAVRTALEAAVKKRMMTERPVAALLSGGIDSSLIASLVAKNLREAGAPPLKTFSIGMPGSSDLAYAKKVAAWIGSDHHEIVMDADQFWFAIPEVIHDIESFDTTTVRASVGNWLVAREVARQSDCKVVFNGDGSDEVFGSYLYFYKAPSDGAYEEEVVRLLKDIHYFDVLRSDRSISSHGLEPRTPFLDKTFVQTVLSIPLHLRRPTGIMPEKWLLRKAFDDSVTLPHEVLWRRKEAFSDGVSGKEKAWYEIAQERAAELFTTESLGSEKPEMALYRKIFEDMYSGHNVTAVPYFWMPKWCEGTTDPSARALSFYAGLNPRAAGSGQVEV